MNENRIKISCTAGAAIYQRFSRWRTALMCHFVKLTRIQIMPDWSKPPSPLPSPAQVLLPRQALP